MKYLIFLLLISIVFTKCRKKPDAQPDYLLTRSIGIYFRDSITNELLLGKNTDRYNIDTIKMFRLYNGIEEAIGGVRQDGSGNYTYNAQYLLQMATQNKDIQNISFDFSFLIYLKYHEADTLKITKSAFSDINVYWKNNLIKIIPELDNQHPYYITLKN